MTAPSGAVFFCAVCLLHLGHLRDRRECPFVAGIVLKTLLLKIDRAKSALEGNFNMN